MTDIQAFAGTNYTKNADRCKDSQTPCAHCGKGIEDSKVVASVHVEVSLRFIPKDAEVADGFSQGWWPIGADCIKVLEKQHPGFASKYVAK